jgi:hypothetical protein
VPLSKSIIGRWRSCRLAYRFERIERLPDVRPPSSAQLRGTAAHEATATILKRGIDPNSNQAVERIARVAGKHGLTDNDADPLSTWVHDAVAIVLARGGRLRWVEELVAVARTSAFTLWARFDVVVVAGRVAPLEVIDHTFGARRVRSEDELLASVGAHMYRLAAGHAEPDRAVRPIAISESHAPSGSVISVVPDDTFVS